MYFHCIHSLNYFLILVPSPLSFYLPLSFHLFGSTPFTIMTMVFWFFLYFLLASTNGRKRDSCLCGTGLLYLVILSSSIQQTT
jgi:hypothetical protein